MGGVAMGAGGSFTFEDSTITQTAYCVYCDKCGSFSIGKRITTKALVAVLVMAVMAAVFVHGLGNGVLPGAWLACFGSSLFLVSLTGVLAFGQRCRKCGNIDLSRENVFDYPEYDRSILDVPCEAPRKASGTAVPGCNAVTRLTDRSTPPPARGRQFRAVTL
jgi:hypothetical protein